MSFMFKPLKYDDPRPVNRPALEEKDVSDITFGTVASGKRLAADVIDRVRESGLVVAMDGYAGACFDDLYGAFAQELRQLGANCDRIDMDDVYKPVEEIDEIVAPCLPPKSDEDPVQLFGVLYKGEISDFFSEKSVLELRAQAAKVGPGSFLVITGKGSCAPSLLDFSPLRVYFDVTPKEAAIRAREGRLRNIGDRTPRKFKEIMRRNYYVDFEVILKLRKELLTTGCLDYYVCADKPEDFALMKGSTILSIMDALADYPFRTKPVYLEGIWGGEYMRSWRDLPGDSKNVAWIFDLIPLEVSVLVDVGGRNIEFPFSSFTEAKADKIIGPRANKQFNGYFPIRFNYDDTYHSNGNMSVQCHPYAKLCRETYGEPGSQDEAYYVVATAHGAKTFIGFREDADPHEFIKLVKQSEKDGSEVDYQRYVNHIDSVPGRQIMIPGGTIHASGRGQLILELGSLTMGSYTYKLYDYNRIDSDGQRRPIHTTMGERALHFERTSSWVDENIAIKPIPDGEGDGWKQFIIGKTDLMYYMTRNLFMDAGVSASFSNEGLFTVLTLVDGEHIHVYSKTHPEFSYDQNYLDIVIVPASIDDYVIENTGYQPVVVHKTTLRPDFEEVINNCKDMEA
ncbi:class I mannose-6-phosphate isomerase [Olsenella sp. AM04-33]|uniref:class I mannose-6-phosphate isomerase n=1 Tax=Olsenella sp. AM04-33 TaxID=2292049 RepID=UPI000E4E7E3F|nr:class I mannose-6-phosphate isomerase [Olsenella sp. AM04-33]RHK01162.1 hypothetical protein DW087_09895 [Olsenella sp. AM04-33]